MNNIMAVWKKRRRRIKRRQPTQHIQITSLHSLSSSSSSSPPSSQTVSWLLSSHLVTVSVCSSWVFFLVFLGFFFKATSRLHWLVKWNDVTPEQPPYWWMVGQPGWKQLCCCVAAHCKSGPKVNIESSSSSKPEIRGERKKKRRL